VRRILAATLLLCAQGAWAAESPQPARASGGGVLHGDIEEGAEGAAVDFVGTADTDHFRSARLRAGALLQHESADKYIALGGGYTRYEQNDFAANRYSLGAAIRNVVRSTGAGVVATGGVSQVGDRTRAVFEATWNVRLSQTGGFELIGQRDFVESSAALDAGTMTNFVGASVDYTIADRLTLIALGGLQYFSDDNRRDHLRARVIYVLLPEQGLSVQAKVRAYESSNATSAFYFNPENYREADIGLRLRRSVGNWRLLAAAGGGKEEINRSVENRTYYVEARAERRFADGVSLVLSYALDHSAGSDSSSGGGHYTWNYFRAVLVIPF